MTRIALHREVLDPALAFLPEPMDSWPARAMLEAIAKQESGPLLVHRRQIGSYRLGLPVYGPARGLWMFEQEGGLAGVLEHRATRAHAERVCQHFRLDPSKRRDVHLALERNDVLAASLARLLLYTDPRLLPQSADDHAQGWLIYLATWNPGKPKAPTWAAYFRAAWEPLDLEVM